VTKLKILFTYLVFFSHRNTTAHGMGHSVMTSILSGSISGNCSSQTKLSDISTLFIISGKDVLTD